jgi:AspT/YidE/YbjL antiporter-like protein
VTDRPPIHSRSSRTPRSPYVIGCDDPPACSPVKTPVHRSPLDRPVSGVVSSGVATDLLVDHPMLLLFALVGAGAAIGRVELRGFSLGPAAVLFVALGVSAADEELALSIEVQTLGLVLFTYAVGLACGPAFVAGLRGRGLTSLATVTAAIAAAGGLATVTGRAMGLTSAGAAGLLSGALTNTPALGAVIDSAPPAEDAAAASAYALAGTRHHRWSLTRWRCRPANCRRSPSWRATSPSPGTPAPVTCTWPPVTSCPSVVTC